MLAIAMAGCSTRVSQEYGESEGYSAKCSPGGMTVFRDMVEKRGMDTLSIRSLSPANRTRLQTIVWVPDAFPNHRTEVYAWMQAWLAEGDRTLVVIGRDFSPHAAYWSELANRDRVPSLGTNPSRLASERAAGEQAALDGKRRSVRTPILTPWCRWDLDPAPVKTVSECSGPWGKALDGQTTRIEVRSRMSRLKVADVTVRQRVLDAAMKSASANANKKQNPFDENYTSEDAEQNEFLKTIGPRIPEWTILLADEGGQSLIAVASDGYLESSQVLLVVNNSMFSNYGMLQPSHRELAGKLIDEFSWGSVGFLTGDGDPPIRTGNEEEKQKGFEMLTVWPLNVVTIHAAFLGLAIMIAAFPIFGRPKRLPQPSTSDFGQHIEAVGQLLQRSGDRDYALRAISDYFRIVRGETSSPWIVPAPERREVGSPFQPIDPQVEPPDRE